MEDCRKPEWKQVTVPIWAKDYWGRPVRTVATIPVDPSDLVVVGDSLQWLTWAGECLRPETVKALAESYKPLLAQSLESEAAAHFLRVREERLRAERTPMPEGALDPNKDWVRLVVRWQLEGWIESSPVLWSLASLALIWHTVLAWQRYEDGMGKGLIGEMYRTTGLSGAKADAISSDEFSLATGPFFRDQLVPGMVKCFVDEAMLSHGASIDEVDAYFGLRRRWGRPDAADTPEPSSLPA